MAEIVVLAPKGATVSVTGENILIPSPDSPYIWLEHDSPTVSQMQQYISNIRSLRKTMAMLPTTPQTPENMELLTWAKANHIEQILVDLEALIQSMSAAFLRSGMTWAVSSGPGFYFMN